MSEFASPRIEITPVMLTAAWVEARRWWPRKVVEMHDCAACKQAKGYRVLETCIRVDEPQPGFKEALEAAWKARELDMRGEARP